MTTKYVFVLLSFLALTACTQSQNNPIIIGDLSCYTDCPTYAVPYRNGWQMAVDEVNQTGGLLGGRQVKVVQADNQGSPASSVTKAQELLYRDGVSHIVSYVYDDSSTALANLAQKKQFLFMAAIDGSSNIVWENGNRYTYRVGQNNYMFAAALTDVVQKKHGAKTRWATIAPNYEYGQNAVASFKAAYTKQNPEAQWVGEQWPPLDKLDAGASIAAIDAVNPDAVLNVLFSSDVTQFVRRGNAQNFFDDKVVASYYTGMPEELNALGSETPEGWIVTGFPSEGIDTPEYQAFASAYQLRYERAPVMASIYGYVSYKLLLAAIEKADSNDTEVVIDALAGLSVETPVGRVSMRGLDHQSTMGVWVGETAVVGDEGRFVNWDYRPGEALLPSDEWVRAHRFVD